MTTSWLDDLRRRRPAGLDRSGYHVLCAVAERSDYTSGRNSRSFQARLADASGYSVGHVRRVLCRLVADGWLERRRTGRANVYAVNVPHVLDALGRLVDVPATRDQTAPDARSDRASARAPKTTVLTTVSTLAPEPLEQLALGLLDAVAREDVHPDRFALAVTAAASLPPGTDPDRCRKARRRWLELGRDPANATPRTIARDLDDLAPVRHRPARPARRADCSTCDGQGLTLDEDDRARPCPACAPETARG